MARRVKGVKAMMCKINAVQRDRDVPLRRSRYAKQRFRDMACRGNRLKSRVRKSGGPGGDRREIDEPEGGETRETGAAVEQIRGGYLQSARVIEKLVLTYAGERGKKNARIPGATRFGLR